MIIATANPKWSRLSIYIIGKQLHVGDNTNME
jgi:hypothetical protein